MDSMAVRIEENNGRQSDETVLPQKFKMCTFCNLPNVAKKTTLTWQTMEFCSVECLSRYQIQHWSYCFFCRCLVRLSSIGKYAVRFGFEIRQFCSGACLEESKKNLKLCRHCQVNLTHKKDSSIRVPLGGKKSTSIDQAFCSQSCVKNHELMWSGSKIPPSGLREICTVCASKKQVEIQVIQDSGLISLCSYICFKTFRFANSMDEISHCNVCKKFFPPNLPDSSFLRHNGILLHFCCKICHNIFLLMKRKIVSCCWCKAKKYDHDMIKQTSNLSDLGGECVICCSINCWTLYRVSLRASTKLNLRCDLCHKLTLPKVNIIMPDASTRHFCSYECVGNFRARNSEAPSVLLEKDKPDSVPPALEFSTASQKPDSIAANTVLPSTSPALESRVVLKESSTTNTNLPEKIKLASIETLTKNDPTKCIQQIILKPPEPKNSTNKFAQPMPSTKDEECQTDDFLKYPRILCVPVPVSLPLPVPVYARVPVAIPVPVAHPYPVPVLIPTPKKTYRSIMFQNKINPADSGNGSVKRNRIPPVIEENGLENITSEIDDDMNTCPSEGTSVRSSSLPDDNEQFPQNEELVFNKALDEISQSNQKVENVPATQNPVFDSVAGRASNVRPGTQINDDGEKVNRKQTNPTTENKRAILNSVVKLQAKSVSVLLVPRTRVEDDGENVPQNVKSRRNECFEKSENKNACQNIDELISKPASGTQIQDDGEKVRQNIKFSEGCFLSHFKKTIRDSGNKNELQNPVLALKTKLASNLIRPTLQVKKVGEKVIPSVESGGSVISRKLAINKIIQSRLKTEDERAASDSGVKFSKVAAVALRPRSQMKECIVNIAHAEIKALLRKRISELAASPSNSKRSRLELVTNSKPENNGIPQPQPLSSVSSSSPFDPEQATADPPLSLKVSEGLNVWKQWLTATNARIKKAAHLTNERPKFFNTNILKLRIDELNHLLCKFVKEIRQPSGAEYAADSIYYLCLCIQHHLFENGCINNIFVDNLYQPFINALDEVARKFSRMKDTSQYFPTGGVEEELLWECEQLGGHSPYILLVTLLFFNTKYFKVSTLEEHMRISFSNIVRMKNQSSSTSVGSNKTVVLRFYPSTTAFGVPKSHKKTYYEVHEDEENVLRCPVRLYEFYLSKCHERVKQRSDVFYLQPEGNCLLESPIWFSATPLPKDILAKMLRRIQMVKEIDI